MWFQGRHLWLRPQRTDTQAKHLLASANYAVKHKVFEEILGKAASDTAEKDKISLLLFRKVTLLS